MLIFSTTILNLRCSYIHTLSMNSSFSAFQQSFQLSKKLFSNSIMRHCVWRVTTFASCVQKIFKNKYQLFTSEAGSNLIFFSTPNQGKVGQSNSRQSKERAWLFQQQNNITARVFSYCCVSLCIFVFLICVHAAVSTFCFLCVSNLYTLCHYVVFFCAFCVFSILC